MVAMVDRDDTVRQEPTLRGVGEPASPTKEDVGSAPTMAVTPALAETMSSASDELPSTRPLGRAPHDPGALAEIRELDGSRYTLGVRIGEGGMGEVLVAYDEQIGREVAVKRIRAANPTPDELARFVREARVQGRLEHPAVVPVHDLAVDREGRPYFVMKRLSGTVMSEVLARLRAGEEGDAAATRRRLLRAFADVCLAIELAHQHGIIHRDLKPANIMLGEFGEVYVLDWGVARAVLDPGEPAAPALATTTPRPAPPDLALGTGDTQLGTVLGTPAYMAPEQLAGDRAGPPADIYALGTILFEIVAGQALHPRARSVGEALAGVDARPSRVRPDAPPELDAICARACATDPAARFESARALGAAVQAFLDGDRDLAVRTELARHHVEEARRQLALGDGEDPRRAAMQAAGRALALDPTAADAAEVLTRLLLEPPKQVPAEVDDRVAAIDTDTARMQGRLAAAAMLGYLAFLPFLAWTGIRDATMIVVFVALALACGLQVLALTRKDRISAPGIYVSACINAALIGIVCRITGPFMIAPTLVTTTLMAYAAHPAFGRMRIVAFILGCGVAVPWLLELAGVLAPTYRFADGAIVITSPIVEFAATPVQLGFHRPRPPTDAVRGSRPVPRERHVQVVRPRAPASARRAVRWRAMVDDRDALTLPREPYATTQPGATVTRMSSTQLAVPVTLPPQIYEMGAVIGRGGMGEVLAAHDPRIGREVALKRMRSESPTGEAVGRFLREARIQARLDHPAIVPVHELGTDEAGRPYFTMKRLAGRTLSHRLADGGALNRILRAFVEVCLAVEYAHARGVIHRDLKPSNIMLGDYGEVYVLDWGIARVLDLGPRAPSEPGVVADDIDTLEGTRSDAMLGTPGYMAPEQARGLGVAPAADVYSLGAILFEILAGKPLHPRGEGAIGSTLANPQQSPALRRGDGVPPELDAICLEALAEDPTARPSAHELAERVQRYLDGDRDVERRRWLAAQQLESALDALATGGAEGRATAMRRAGRALALDPESTEAADLVSSLVLEPPEVMPKGLVADVEAHERQLAQHRSKQAMLAYLSIVALFPAVLFLHVTNWTMVGAFYGAVALALALTFESSRTGHPRVVPLLVVNLALAVLFTRIGGPFILTPLLVCAVLVGITAIPWVNQRSWLVVGWTIVAVMLPMILEWVGLLPRTWTIVDGVTMVRSTIFHARGSDGAEAIALIVTNLVFTTVVGLVALSISRRRQDAQRQLFVQTWHLRHLIPERGKRGRWATNPR